MIYRIDSCQIQLKIVYKKEYAAHISESKDRTQTLDSEI